MIERESAQREMTMSRVVEIDFFSMEKEKGQKSTIRDFQSFISKINPQLIRHVITSASVPHQSLPVPVHESRSDSEISQLAGTTPLTMFYNGKVMVFNLSNEKAENIMKMAGDIAAPLCVTDTTNRVLGNVTGELPMARKKSLQRFLAKRKARLTDSGPYQRDLEIYSITRG